MILVTGGTGLVGSHLLYKLILQGTSVRAIYRDDKKIAITKKIFSYYTEQSEMFIKKIDWVTADLLDIPSLTDAFTNVTEVYHCAGYISFDPDEYYLLRRINIEGTANIVNLCIANNIKKLCYISSIATLGSPPKNKPITETTYWNPDADNNSYAITKYGAEMEVWRGSQEGIPVVIINPGVILGAGIWDSGSGSIFKKVYEGLSYYPNGSLGLVSVTDVVQIAVELMKSSIVNQRYIVVSENLKYQTLLQTIASNLGVKPPKKQVSKYVLQIGWRLDWILKKLFKKQQQLTRHLVVTLNKKSHYSNAKVTQALHYTWQPLSKEIKQIADKFLEETQA